MTLMYYGSPLYLGYLIVSAGLILAVCFACRNRSELFKFNLLFVFAALNVIQHLFKSLIWPHRFGAGFNLENTAYNVCAFLILLTPFLLRRKSGIAREFLAYTGTLGPSLSFVIPFWFIGRDIASPDVIWEFLRFWTCHWLLLATSVLPLLWGLIRFRNGNYRYYFLLFLGMLTVILLNDILCYKTGLVSGKDLYTVLCLQNPLSLVRPPEELEWLTKLLVFLPPLKNGVYLPVLWYALPVSVGVTLLGYGFELARRRRRKKPSLRSCDLNFFRTLERE